MSFFKLLSIGLVPGDKTPRGDNYCHICGDKTCDDVMEHMDGAVKVSEITVLLRAEYGIVTDDYDDFVLPTKRVKRQPRTADELWVMHEHLTDGITDVLKHITAVNFYTPLGCLAQMHALSGAKRFHAKDMTRKFQQMFSTLGQTEKTILWKLSQATMMDAFFRKRYFYAVLKELTKKANRICEIIEKMEIPLSTTKRLVFHKIDKPLRKKPRQCSKGFCEFCLKSFAKDSGMLKHIKTLHNSSFQDAIAKYYDIATVILNPNFQLVWESFQSTSVCLQDFEALLDPESAKIIATLMNSQDNLHQIHNANPLEPPGVSSFVSQLSDQQSQEGEKDDVTKSTIIKEEIHLVSYADVEVDNSSLDTSIKPILPLVLSSNFAQNSTFMEAIEEDESFIIHECDYKILGSIDKYHPDIVISATTAVLVVHVQEKFEKTRLRISLASLKFTTCWVIILAPGGLTSTKPPAQWESLKVLAKFYENNYYQNDTTEFLLLRRIANTYRDVVFFVKDAALDEIHQDINSSHHPLSAKAKLLLQFPQLNAVTAPLIAQHFDAKELVTLPVETLCNRIPTLRHIIKTIRNYHHTSLQLLYEMDIDEQKSSVEDMDTHPFFGQLKNGQPWNLETVNVEECELRQLPTFKTRSKL